MRPEEQTRIRHRRLTKGPVASHRRLIFLSSMTHRAGRLNFSNLQLENGYSGSLPACCISHSARNNPRYSIELQTIDACLQASRGMQIQSLPLCWLQRSGRHASERARAHSVTSLLLCTPAWSIPSWRGAGSQEQTSRASYLPHSRSLHLACLSASDTYVFLQIHIDPWPGVLLSFACKVPLRWSTAFPAAQPALPVACLGSLLALSNSIHASLFTFLLIFAFPCLIPLIFAVLSGSLVGHLCTRALRTPESCAVIIWPCCRARAAAGGGPAGKAVGALAADQPAESRGPAHIRSYWPAFSGSCHH